MQNNKINYKNKSIINNTIIKIPQNFFDKQSTDIFNNTIEEKRELEQFFWTKQFVQKIVTACEWIMNPCCLTTPSLAYGFLQKGREEKLLGIDERFSFMSGFERFDITDPHTPDGSNDFQIIVIDPLFFNVTTKQLLDATNVITNYDYNTNIVIAYLVRYEFSLLETFKQYKISETNAIPEYAHIKPNKWKNFRIYANIDLPGMKRIPGKYGYKGVYN